MLKWLRLRRTVMHIRGALRDGFSEVECCNPDEEWSITLRQWQLGIAFVKLMVNEGGKRKSGRALRLNGRSMLRSLWRHAGRIPYSDAHLAWHQAHQSIQPAAGIAAGRISPLSYWPSSPAYPAA